ncbi:MAG: acylneuraminate cytidylyltransferase family protein [Synergistaceae bacterium]|nr:acylneuraminate cytidylyltransferase family protein [Synergistaceae bacterium]
MNTIAFIPVRGGSKSIPMKNIRPFCGHPLVYWTARAANDAQCVDSVIIASDSRDILRTAESFGMKKVRLYERDPANAQDSSSTESVMLEYIHAAGLNDDDVFILVQATSPLTQSHDIDGAMMLFREGGYDSLLTCSRTKRFFWEQDGRPINYDFMNRPRRQDFAGTLMENGAFYISTVKAIRESECRLSGKIAVYEMPEYCGIELDEPSDWALAEEFMHRHSK